MVERVRDTHQKAKVQWDHAPDSPQMAGVPDLSPTSGRACIAQTLTTLTPQEHEIDAAIKLAQQKP